MNLTMRTITVVVGLVLIALGLYEAFIPQKVVDFGPLEVSAKEGLTTESLLLIGLGVLVLVASFLKRK